MADVKWIKIVTDIFDDEKVLLIESLPEHDAIIVIWFKLLCLSGKMNNSGVFMMNDKIPYTDEMLATIFRRSLNTVRLALNTFESFGMIERIDNVITIPNWSKHQTMDQLEERKEYMRDYMQKYREKQKEIACKVNSKPNSKANVNSLDKNKNKRREDKEEDKKENNKEPIAYVSDDLLNQTILDFIESRKKKAPMTEKAIELMIKKLNKMTTDNDEKIEILNQSIIGGWKGIFPLKEQNNKVKSVLEEWGND